MNSKKGQISYAPALNESESADLVAVACCRGCGEPSTEDVVDLGSVPLANSLVSQGHAETTKTFPLSVFFCKKCTLTQLRQTVSPRALFSEYPYFSSFSDTMLESSRKLAIRVAEQLRLNSHSLVLEVGSNDGYLLKNYLQMGIPVLGIEPAKNIAEFAQAKGIPTLEEFFSLALAKTLSTEGKKADVLHGNNVIAHIPNVRENFEAISTILKDDGIAIIEVPYVKPLLDDCLFDTIYHEHFFYFSLTSIKFLANSAHLQVLDVEELAIHGGSLRITLGLAGKSSESVGKLLEREKQWGVGEVETYHQLNEKINHLGERLRKLLGQLKSQGKNLAAYGASAKGTTLLSVLDIGVELNFVADRNISKQGCLTPGTNLKILHPDALRDHSIDYALLLVWNCRHEIFDQQLDYLKQGGAFIVPLPELRIVSFDHTTNKIVESAVP